LFLEGVANALDFAEAILGHDLFERLVESFEGARSVGVGACLERVLAFEFEQDPDFNEDVRDLLFVHARSLCTISPCTSVRRKSRP